MDFLVGIDEAGRGPLAGPVAVGAVAVPVHFDWSLVLGVRDSKQLSEKKREALYETLVSLRAAGNLRFAVGFSDANTIDTVGIVPAIHAALLDALTRLEVSPTETNVLLDGGLTAPDTFLFQKTIIKGDALEPVISLASIAAKVERDRFMLSIASEYAQYAFDVHKGYGTVKHREAIRAHGLSTMHRRSFCGNLINVA